MNNTKVNIRIFYFIKKLIKLKIMFFIFFPVLSHSISCGKFMKKLSETIIFSIKSKSKLQMTGDPRFDQFREAFNKGDVMKGNNMYISYMKADELGVKTRLFGRVFAFTHSEIVVTPPRGGSFEIVQGKELNDVRTSLRSKNHFESMDRYEDALRLNRLLEGSNMYISYYDKDLGEERFGKVKKAEPGHVYITTDSGQEIKLDNGKFVGIKISEDSKRFFEARARE